jgi:hypothetical protein
MVGTIVAITIIGTGTAIFEKVLQDDEGSKEVVRTAGIIASSILALKCAYKVIKEIKSLGL